MPMLVEQGEEAMQNLLGQETESGNFGEACGATAALLDDVRHAQVQVGLSSEEQNAWGSQVWTERAQ